MPVYVSQSPSCVYYYTMVDYEYDLDKSIHYAIKQQRVDGCTINKYRADRETDSYTTKITTRVQRYRRHNFVTRSTVLKQPESYRGFKLG